MRLQSCSIALFLIASVCTCSNAQRTDKYYPGVDISQSGQISEYVREVFQDREGNYWFGTNGDGVVRYDGESLTYLSMEEGFGGRAVRGILQSSDGDMWFATSGGVSRLNSGKFTNYTTKNGLSNNQVWSMMLDRSGTIWVGTHTGVCYFDGESFIPFPLPRMEIENPSSRFSPSVVFGMFEDQEGNLWFGTDGEGAHKYDGTSFTSYSTKNGLAGNIVRSIYGDRQGRIWIGTNGGGVSRLEDSVFQNFTKVDGLNNNRIYEIIQDRAGNMWFSTLGAGASRYDGKTFTSFREDRIQRIHGNPAHGHVQEFFEDKDGVLWIGCSGGLFYFDGTTFVNVKRDGPWPVKLIDEPEPISLEGWASETFALPPGFAPELPAGTESLLFAPGWRDPNTENFWSYAFVMSIDEAAPDTARIDELLETYYNGLMSVFASNNDAKLRIKPVIVDVERKAANHFEAKMHLIDAFATFKPVDIRVVVETVADGDEHSRVKIQVSKQPKGHKIWRSLEAAIERIETQAISLEALKDRSVYALFDKQAVEALAHAAESHWPQEFSGFTYQRVEHFSAGGVSHWMSIWLHDKTGLEFVLAPGGRFQMGSPETEVGRRDDEPQNWVTLDPFLIARTECTREAWARIASTKIAKEAGLNGGQFDGSGQLPVSGIGPADVEIWCREASLSFPTEAQWEYMCRAGTTTPWAMGADKNDLIRLANLGSLECPADWVGMPGITESWHDGYGAETAEVGAFQVNAFGLFDVHGNLNEYVRDFYLSYEVPAEKGTGERRGNSKEHNARGGNYGGDASAARSSTRLTLGWGVNPGGGGNHGFGFRPSVDLPF